MITLDRFDVTPAVLANNIQHSGHEDGELLIADNGSTDKRIVEFVQDQVKPAYHRVNSVNEGVGRAFNQLFLRSTGEYICLLGNDILLPPNWAKTMIAYLDNIPNPGICGIDWGHSGMPPIDRKFGVVAHWLTPVLDKVFGVCMFKRHLIEELGFFCDAFYPYGLEDSDFNNRVNLAGFNSFYVPNTILKSNHIVHDVGEDSDYRRMKDESLTRNAQLMGERVKNYHEIGIRETLPTLRDPL
jgi:GT2 family glycosyltransferase